MKFERLKHRVERTEALVDGRARQTLAAYASFRSTWREGWTPTRILIAGLLSGFIVGHTEPSHALKKIGAVGGPRWIQLIGAVSGLLASLQSTVAAVTAKDAAKTANQAADTADHAADAAGDAVDAADHTGRSGDGDAAHEASLHITTRPESLPPAERRRRPDPAWDAQPRAAEAATDVSER